MTQLFRNNPPAQGQRPSSDKSGSWCLATDPIVTFYPELPVVPCAPGYHQATWSDVLAAVQGEQVSIPVPSQVPVIGGQTIGGPNQGLTPSTDVSVPSLGDWQSGLGKLTSTLTNRSYLKGAGLIAGAVLLGILGVVLFTGRGIERAVKPE